MSSTNKAILLHHCLILMHNGRRLMALSSSLCAADFPLSLWDKCNNTYFRCECINNLYRFLLKGTGCCFLKNFGLANIRSALWYCKTKHHNELSLSRFSLYLIGIEIYISTQMLNFSIFLSIYISKISWNTITSCYCTQILSS